MTRIERIKKRLPDLYIDAFLVTNQENLFYLTGFTLTEGDGALLITNKSAILITDDRYAEALREFDSQEVVGMITRDYYGTVNEIMQKLGLTVLGFESSLSYGLFDQLDELMVADIVPFTNLVENYRAEKESSEVETLRQSTSLHDKGFDYVLGMIKPGMSELEVANRLDFWMKEHGASEASFPTIVASGANAAKPHATASKKLIEKGDVVTLDFGYFVDGYTADMTRTFAVGEPDFEFKTVYKLVNEARQAVIEKAQAGVRGDKLDYAGRHLIEEAGYGDEFQHGMGHGIGLTVHELPASYGPKTKQVVLKHNQIITVEPGIYLPGLFGVRIEDDLLITHSGCEVLTQAPTNLITV
ncbi:MAG TPA: aminopeptidase P family protein [Candidatus Limosilactobacillus faecipullorum]|nr:aminopeptidase P family protein [Candidatus Limosilactobacillus faecipullorum]